ncbi:MAG: hypothetical protein DLM67_01525 [Candidatus Nephthysia bennettiae]|uniref:DUF6760 family protein n=1 Tax=Candidatus Nephthysia bennettiae TaxID=3127016 RepID=UPI000DB564C5|nr:MAG: hypothetical protein DLM67_01525 [Candidatus Dormibacteraeota bacterium]
MRARVPGGGERPGGVRGYPLDSVYEEVAFIAYHFHWDEERILSLEHIDRRRWAGEISRLNQRVNEESAGG